ncbi:hypothetical protein [Hydrogenovibrio marinus]|uniref:hypothetical protein n=1 Tax=Hydrogenovibrio marinus TaxID=28885 RepID=UPI0012DF8AD6|nr:hypothetical protein [Hydrogenovibrio marinus]
MKISTLSVVFFIALVLVRMPVYADETFGKLFLTPQQREQINQQRQAFLYKEQGVKPAASQQKAAVKPSKSTRLGSPVLTLSSIITTPEGQLFRLNGKYVKHDKSGYRLKQNLQEPHSAQVLLKGKEINLKVGETYVPGKDKKVKSYLITPKQKQEKIKLSSVREVSPASSNEQQMDLSSQIENLQRLTELTK